MRILRADGTTFRPEDVVEDLLHQLGAGTLTREQFENSLHLAMPGLQDGDPEYWSRIMEQADGP